MGYEKLQRNKRWSGLYELRPNVYRSAGVFDTRREARDAWQEIERDLRRGTFVDPAKGRWPFRRYVEEVFLPLHTGVKINTIKNYKSDSYCELMPFFADMRLAEIYPQHVRLWIKSMEAAGLAPSTIRTRKATLSTILSQAVQDQYLAANHALHVKTPKEPPQRIRALTPTDIPRILAGLPGPVSTMLVELAVHTGLRWGEITELRGRDVLDDEDDDLRVYLWVTRAVVDVGAEYTAVGGRFHVEDTTKGSLDRKVGLSVRMTDKVLAFMEAMGMGQDDLLFPLSALLAEFEAAQTAPSERSLADMPADLEPLQARNGRTYEHGTTNAYDTGRCRCEWCRLAGRRPATPGGAET